MKAWFGAHKSRTPQISLDFSYNTKRSVWSELAAQPHLIVMAAGTLMLLGLAGGGIWLTLPSDQASAPMMMAAANSTASIKPASPAPVKFAQIDASELRTTTDDPSETTADAPQMAEQRVARKPVQMAAATSPRPRVKPAEARNAHLTAMNRETAPVEPRSETTETHTMLSAYAGDGQSRSGSAAVLEQQAANLPDEEVEDSAPQQSASGKAGKILRAVTMRARPDRGGEALGTAPANASVEVLSCKQWCEIVYKGKRGFIYKSYLSRG